MRQSRNALIAALSVQRTSTMRAMANNKNDVDVSSPTSTCSFSSSDSSSTFSSSTSSSCTSSPPPLLLVTSPEQKVSKIVPPSPSMFTGMEPQLKYRLSEAVVLDQKRMAMMAARSSQYSTYVHSPRPVSASSLSTPRYLPLPNMMYYSFEASSKNTASAKANAYKPSTPKKAAKMAASSWRKQDTTKAQANTTNNKAMSKEKGELLSTSWRRHQPCPNDIYFVATPASPLSPVSPKQLVFAVQPAQEPQAQKPRATAKMGLQALTQSALRRNSKRAVAL